MKTYYPNYYGKFSCIAGKCPDSCCRSWEIVIDEETCRKYDSLQGELAEKIRSFIVKDRDGDSCFSLVDGRCPFLNGEGLCDIHIKLGEELTSDICKVHPRFIEEYDGFTEISLSLSCPEACRIIFSDEAAQKSYPVPEYKGDDEALSLLISSRKALIEARCDFLSLVSLILNTSADDSLDIDAVYIADFPVLDCDFIKDFLLSLSGLEILTDEWKNMLKNALSTDLTDEKIVEYISIYDRQLVIFCRYMLYRYYLKAVNDLDVYSRALFIISSCLGCAYISITNNKSFEECARLISKEAEHNTENIDSIVEYFSNF